MSSHHSSHHSQRLLNLHVSRIVCHRNNWATCLSSLLNELMGLRLTRSKTPLRIRWPKPCSILVLITFVTNSVLLNVEKDLLHSLVYCCKRTTVPTFSDSTSSDYTRRIQRVEHQMQRRSKSSASCRRRDSKVTTPSTCKYSSRNRLKTERNAGSCHNN